VDGSVELGLGAAVGEAGRVAVWVELGLGSVWLGVL